MKGLAVLGSTGSIGTQTLDVAERHGFRVTALTAYRSVDRIEEQARRFRPALVALLDEDAAATLKIRLADTSVRVVGGMDGVCDRSRQDARPCK